MEEYPTSHDVDFGGSLQHSSLVGAAFAINLGYVPRDARCSYFTQGIPVGKGSELYNNISPKNWCQYSFKKNLDGVTNTALSMRTFSLREEVCS